MDSIKKSFPVTGMTCASCALKVEKALQHQKGVSSAAVDLVGNTVTVIFDPAVNPDNLKRAVQAAGYGLLTGDEAANAEEVARFHERSQKVLKISVLCSIFLSVPLVILEMFFMHHPVPYQHVIAGLLAAPVVWICGFRFFRGAITVSYTHLTLPTKRIV